jgi:ABC-type multidrug transport system fused ATPase/permease subunit
VFPFFAIAADPSKLRHSTLGARLLHYLPPVSDNHLLIGAGCFAIGMLVLAAFGSMASEAYRIRYAYGFCHWLRQKLFDSYARQPYAFFLNRHSAELNQQLLDVLVFTQDVLLPVGEIITRIVILTLMAGAFLLAQPLVALGAITILGGYYLLVFVWLRPRTRLVSDGLHQHHLGFNKNTVHFLHGIKTILVQGKEKYFKDRALEHSAKVIELQSKIPLYTNGPRTLIEPVCFGALIFIVVVLAIQGRTFIDLLPSLTIIAFAGYRMMPSLQLLYNQFVILYAHKYLLDQLEAEIAQIAPKQNTGEADAGGSPLTFNRDIRLDNVSFQYPSAAAPVLEDFCLTIGRNESLGIAGPSGSGKSTLVDLILGLHSPQSGTIYIDDVPVDQTNMASWRQIIGYVPQDIYLIDDTVAANIAFGVNPAEVNLDALRKAAEGAQILDFVQLQLPQGFQTLVGERGTRLSGGQRQRVGLARALYHRPQILILDEATSALDHQTELAVMQTIKRLQGTLTIISIAHRLSTLESCDRIITLGKGRILSPDQQLLEKPAQQ